MLEYVRQLFANGCIRPGFSTAFHRAFPVAEPRGIRRDAGPCPGDFAKNDVAFIDPTGVECDALGASLEKPSTTTCTASAWKGRAHVVPVQRGPDDGAARPD